jgi:arabinose-5-phosphate isomerase
MDYLKLAKRVFEIELSEGEATAARLDGQFVAAVDLIKAAVEQRNKVVVLGVGKSGNIGEKIAATLTSTGSTAVVLNSLNALHGDLGIVADGDVLLALSYSGETQELLAVLPAIVRFGLPIIAITGDKNSSLAKAAQVVLDISVTQEACPLNLAPTSSTTAMLVLGDALAMVLLESRGFQKEDFAKFHPGGSLGRSLLLRVNQIMRPLAEMALISPGTPIVEAIQAMTSKRAGAAVVTHPDGTLAGIFTHGDFARHFPGNPGIGTTPVGDFMSLRPVTIDGSKLAAEALQILERHRIDDLVVLDEGRCPIGVVDSQDLTRLKIL